jgi:hypothetical protein
MGLKFIFKYRSLKAIIFVVFMRTRRLGFGFGFGVLAWVLYPKPKLKTQKFLCPNPKIFIPKPKTQKCLYSNPKPKPKNFYTQTQNPKIFWVQTSALHAEPSFFFKLFLRKNLFSLCDEHHKPSSFFLGPKGHIKVFRQGQNKHTTTTH